MTRVLLALASTTALALLVTGCSKNNDAPSAADTAASAASAASASAPAASPVGIPECDEYLARYEACLRAASSPVAGALPALKAQRDSFRIAARTPEGKAGLKLNCQTRLDRLATDKACAGLSPAH